MSGPAESSFTAANFQLMVHSPLRQWLIGELDDLLYTGNVPGTVMLKSKPKLFTALTGLTAETYTTPSNFTCCGDFVRTVWTQIWKVGGKTPPADYPAPNFYLLREKLMTWDMVKKKEVDLGKKNGLYPYTYTLAKDSTGPEPGDIYVTSFPHMGFIRQCIIEDGKYYFETYDGGINNANDGIQFSKKHEKDAKFLGWLDIDAALGGDWTQKGTPSWAGVK